MRHRQVSGFSLIELSLVLVILALLLQPLLVPAQQQASERAVQKTQERLEAAKEALIAYALLTGSLPCPDFQLDPSHPDYGLPAGNCSAQTSEGWLPFKALGLPEGDGWFDAQTLPGGRIHYRVDPAFTAPQPITANTGFSAAALSVLDHQGRKLTSDTERPVAILFSTGPNGLPDGENAHFESTGGRYESHVPLAGFDDQLVWLGRPGLLSILIRGGKGF